MGVMVEGEWRPGDAPGAVDAGGAWRRTPSVVRNWITRDGAPGPTGEGGFPAEAGRYRLYAAPNCPWAHRALLARTLLGLEAAIPVTMAEPRRTEEGWVFAETDPVFGEKELHRVYAGGAPGYTGRATVPLLVDARTGRLVSNESADIVRMLDGWAEVGRRLRPEGLAAEIDAWNRLIHRDVNNGVYRAGFAESQAAYEMAALGVFAALDRIEGRLGHARWLCGEAFTEADLRLFPTLARFDDGYYTAFRCNLRRLTEYPNLWAYAREIFQMPGVAATVDFGVYRRGYNSPSAQRNPLGIVPIGPEAADWTAPHGRG